MLAGPARTVEFDFDMRADTAMSVASEMVEDLSLSHDDARAIAAAIKQEVKQLTGQAPMFSVVDRYAAQFLTLRFFYRMHCMLSSISGGTWSLCCMAYAPRLHLTMRTVALQCHAVS